MAIDPYKPFLMDEEQVHEGYVSLHQSWETRTICAVIRKIHLLARHAEVTALCAEAIVMAKAMDGRLRHYKKDWDTGMWQPGKPQE